MARKWRASALESGISRKPGYKFFSCCLDFGLDGLTDRSRRPYGHANHLRIPIGKLIVKLKKEYPGGAEDPRATQTAVPEAAVYAISMVHAVLDRHGLVKRRRHRRHTAQGHRPSRPAEPNAPWCADYKGEFMLADQRYCHRLTITDFASRYLITCEALSTAGDLCLLRV